MIPISTPEKRDLSREVTVFVSTVGDEDNFRDCMAHLERQTVSFRLDVVKNVAPLSTAFQQMHDRCQTPFYVQVDEDMLLFPHAVESLYGRLRRLGPRVAMVAAPLWDCEVERSIYGVKIYRHAIVRKFPYENTFSCEKTQLDRIREAGYWACMLPLGSREICLGEHGKHYTPRTIYARWRRLMQKRRRYGIDVARGVPEPAFLLERYLKSGDPLHLYSLLGAVAGLVCELPPDREADYREESPDFVRLAEHFTPLKGPLQFSAGGFQRAAATRFAATIIIPLLNQNDKYLEQAVKSALAQTVLCETVVVVSSKTKESNMETLNRLQNASARFTVIQQDREGFPAGLNCGIRWASAQRVGFLLSDDWLEPAAVEKCLCYSEDIVSTRHATYAADGVTRIEVPGKALTLGEYNRKPDLERKASYLGHFLLFQKRKILEVGGLDESLGDSPGIDDFDLLWTLLEHQATVAIVEKELYNYRDHDEERLTTRDPDEMRATMRRILAKHGVTRERAEALLARHAKWFGKPLYVVLQEDNSKAFPAQGK